jgi:hypothetical protein
VERAAGGGSGGEVVRSRMLLADSKFAVLVRGGRQ